MKEILAAILEAVDGPILVYFLLINTSYLGLILLAAAEFVHHLRRVEHSGRTQTVSSRLAQGVTLIVPAYNEEAGIVTTVQSLLSLRYPRHEVVVVDDGSTDETFQRLRDRFDLVPIAQEIPQEVPVRVPVRDVHVPADGRTRLTVVRKPNSGKTDTVNTGLNAASEPLIAIVDADCILDPDALIAVAAPFAEDPVRTVATGGVVRPANSCRVVDGRVIEARMPSSWMARMQVVEYLRAFLLGRSGWSRLRCLILISGAFGMFRRDVLVEVGGLDPDSIGEDFELVMRMHRHMRRQRRDYRVEFVAEPIAWTEVPTTTAQLRSQRMRWHRGLWEVLWKYRGMTFNPRYGRIGLVALPWFWVFELFAPLLELFGGLLVLLSLAMGLVDGHFAILYVLLAYGYAFFVNVASLTIEEFSFHKYPRWGDLGLAVLASLLENFGFRQATTLWRVEGWWQGVRGRRQVWGTMTRTGIDSRHTRRSPRAPGRRPGRDTTSTGSPERRGRAA
ncbi:MAG TPA: glycosyltransferase [Dermatophilaceae bacterium]|nr:glycosyltransferase [Dermatophilaceae bacterium]